MREPLRLGVVLMVVSCEAFYQPIKHTKMKKITPGTIEELEEALCNKKKGKCDDEPAQIVINKIFDFTDSEGFKTEPGCYHLSEPPKCKVKGQLKLDVNHQCDGLEPAEVTYSVAGRRGLAVGSNKVITGRGGGALLGRGLVLSDVENVEIRNLRITDINPRVIWGGDAIDIRGSRNILIDRCYIKNIGRQMMVTHFGPSTGILVRNTVFNGHTPHSPYCNGRHYWLWLFLGAGDQIAMQNNVVFGTSGRGPHLVAPPPSRSLLHLIQNTFYDIADPGLLVDQGDPGSSVLAEGNVFYQVRHVVHRCDGHIFFPLTAADARQCQDSLGRKCLVNTVVQSGDATPNNDPVVLQDFKTVKHLMTPPIDMKKSITNKTKIPPVVKELIKMKKNL